MVLLDTDSDFAYGMVCWTLTVTVYSVARNGLLETDSDFVQCSREWSCWILTVTLYCVVGNGLVGH